MATTNVKSPSSSTSTSLPKEVFGVEVKDHQLLHTALRAYNAKTRLSSAVTLKRGEVRGGGKKPWRQKGTGRARAGSIRSPLWRGGGITFGPTGKENYQIRLPLKAKKLAIRQALSLQAEAKIIKVVPDIKLTNAKTKEMAKWLLAQNIERSVLLVTSDQDEKLTRAAKNIARLTIVAPKYLNVYQILTADNILITKSALANLVERFEAKK